MLGGVPERPGAVAKRSLPGKGVGNNLRLHLVQSPRMDEDPEACYVIMTLRQESHVPPVSVHIPGGLSVMPYLALPGVDLWYEDTGGTGTPVVFLHAASGTCESWVHQLPAFTTAGYRCITYDRRTWGRSVPTNPEHQPGFPGDDLHALLESLSLERVHLVATAAGGITALDYALTHPQRVRSLVAANTIGGVQDEAYLEVQRRLRPSEIQNLPVELRELGPSYRGTDPDGASRWLEIELASRPGGAVPPSRSAIPSPTPTLQCIFQH